MKLGCSWRCREWLRDVYGRVGVGPWWRLRLCRGKKGERLLANTNLCLCFLGTIYWTSSSYNMLFVHLDVWDVWDHSEALPTLPIVLSQRIGTLGSWRSGTCQWRVSKSKASGRSNDGGHSAAFLHAEMLATRQLGGIHDSPTNGKRYLGQIVGV